MKLSFGCNKWSKFYKICQKKAIADLEWSIRFKVSNFDIPDIKNRFWYSNCSWNYLSNRYVLIFHSFTLSPLKIALVSVNMGTSKKYVEFVVFLPNSVHLGISLDQWTFGPKMAKIRNRWKSRTQGPHMLQMISCCFDSWFNLLSHFFLFSVHLGTSFDLRIFNLGPQMAGSLLYPAILGLDMKVQRSSVEGEYC